ncbi:MAG: tail protein X [Clostridiales bacterium]|jgi:phage tail protein X|nr:tail protein X [Clostridiales bacterium]
MAKSYTTISGDMWDGIAFRTMGSELYTDKLIENNIGHRHIFIFPAGIKLDIPETSAKIPSGLPPWKRR